LGNEALTQRITVSPSIGITQTSAGRVWLQSTTCPRTGIAPEPRDCGAVFWAESEASVQIAPSGMMKLRKLGLNIV